MRKWTKLDVVMWVAVTRLMHNDKTRDQVQQGYPEMTGLGAARVHEQATQG